MTFFLGSSPHWSKAATLILDYPNSQNNTHTPTVTRLSVCVNSRNLFRIRHLYGEESIIEERKCSDKSLLGKVFFFHFSHQKRLSPTYFDLCLIFLRLRFKRRIRFFLHWAGQLPLIAQHHQHNTNGKNIIEVSSQATTEAHGHHSHWLLLTMCNQRQKIA